MESESTGVCKWKGSKAEPSVRCHWVEVLLFPLCDSVLSNTQRLCPHMDFSTFPRHTVLSNWLCFAVFVTCKKTFSFYVLLLNFLTLSLCSHIFIYPSLIYIHSFSMCSPVLKNTCCCVACLYLMIWGLCADITVSFEMILLFLFCKVVI